MKAGLLVRIAGGAMLAGTLGASFAADITSVVPSAPTVSLEGGRAVVRFNVGGSAASQDRCGYLVEYGDGAAGDSRVIERENGTFVRPHERVFTAPGTYTVRARGKMVKTTMGCNGAASATVTVVAAAASTRDERREQRRAERRAESMPSCPEGWMLNERSFNRQTGAFSCLAKAPVQMVCPDGLRYYERDGIIGCRASRRDNNS